MSLQPDYYITVNSKIVRWKPDTITYLDVVMFTEDPKPDVWYSVTYKRGTLHDNQGILLPGKSVQVVDGMQFNAYITSNG